MNSTYVKASNFIANTTPRPITKGVLVKMGQGQLTQGTVLGKETSSGLCVKVDKILNTGAEKAYCVLGNDIDTDQGENVLATGYMTGSFFKDALVFGGESTLADHEDELRDYQIFAV